MPLVTANGNAGQGRIHRALHPQTSQSAHGLPCLTSVASTLGTGTSELERGAREGGHQVWPELSFTSGSQPGHEHYGQWCWWEKKNVIFWPIFCWDTLGSGHSSGVNLTRATHRDIFVHLFMAMVLANGSSLFQLYKVPSHCTQCLENMTELKVFPRPQYPIKPIEYTVGKISIWTPADFASLATSAKKCVIYNCNGRCILTVRNRISTKKIQKTAFYNIYDFICIWCRK